MLMPMSNKTQPIYRMCVRGRLSQTGAAWFEGFTLTVDETTSPPLTYLEGPVMDQAELHGVISRIRDLGLILISVQRLDERSVTKEAAAGVSLSETDEMSLRAIRKQVDGR